MVPNKAKVTHIFHSSFLIETEKYILVFDYFDYTSQFKVHCNKKLSSDFFKTDKNVCVFVSHSHRDHFDPEIFQWQETNSSIKYFLSDDIKVDKSNPNIHSMKQYEKYNIDNIEVNTYGTTDLGVSFLINVYGLSIFHSGDLNWWHWKNDDKKTQLKEEKDFKFEVDKLKEKSIDIAFVPADPRLGDFYYLSSEYFIKTIHPNVLVPMHFADDFYVTENIREKLKGLDTEIVVITEKDREFFY